MAPALKAWSGRDAVGEAEYVRSMKHVFTLRERPPRHLSNAEAGEGERAVRPWMTWDIAKTLREFLPSPIDREQTLGLDRLHYVIEQAGWGEGTSYALTRAFSAVSELFSAEDAGRAIFGISQMIAMGRLDIDHVRALPWGAHELAQACDYADVPTFMHDVAARRVPGRVPVGETLWLRYAALLAANAALARR
jgi:hypothetical protein